ncbi:uncharacterized protein MELLADRAFT_103738 [Melampsora larici-populina 98AG31]|uniref:Uncharacterized protein n=1 Tax=Melampsora larici-populina (strain 98AG31 / pathotype 3-4-7) TaxID=747676 RepID=F4RC78_MELLP|nr:uncharacterized protein MELLADRAFT_103738 [Melampsora larici-populina 98AG31]EGG09690.1 hypothetical protein MELLADRAFT_103738 [Melampsora larici-populina 98AG31]
MSNLVTSAKGNDDDMGSRTQAFVTNPASHESEGAGGDKSRKNESAIGENPIVAQNITAELQRELLEPLYQKMNSLETLIDFDKIAARNLGPLTPTNSITSALSNTFQESLINEVLMKSDNLDSSTETQVLSKRTKRYEQVGNINLKNPTQI